MSDEREPPCEEDDGAGEDAGLDELQPVESSLRSAQDRCASESAPDEEVPGGDGLDELCSPVSELRSVQERAGDEDQRGSEDD